MSPNQSEIVSFKCWSNMLILFDEEKFLELMVIQLKLRWSGAADYSFEKNINGHATRSIVVSNSFHVIVLLWVPMIDGRRMSICEFFKKWDAQRFKTIQEWIILVFKTWRFDSHLGSMFGVKMIIVSNGKMLIKNFRFLIFQSLRVITFTIT